MAYNIGPRIGIDGEREYRRQLSEIIASTKALDAELKALTSSYDDNAATHEDLEAAADVLRRKMEAQTDALARITKLYEAAKTETGESSETTQRWAAAMYNAEAALNETRGKLDETTARIEEMGDGVEGDRGGRGRHGRGIRLRPKFWRRAQGVSGVPAYHQGAGKVGRPGQGFCIRHDHLGGGAQCLHRAV